VPASGRRLAHGGARAWIHGKDGHAGRWRSGRWRSPRVSPAWPCCWCSCSARWRPDQCVACGPDGPQGFEPLQHQVRVADAGSAGQCVGPSAAVSAYPAALPPRRFESHEFAMRSSASEAKTSNNPAAMAINMTPRKRPSKVSMSMVLVPPVYNVVEPRSAPGQPRTRRGSRRWPWVGTHKKFTLRVVARDRSGIPLLGRVRWRNAPADHSGVLPPGQQREKGRGESLHLPVPLRGFRHPLGN
jgi:hypothetical protein